ncbi:hypothetical protein SSX86_025838 [Deinandra increscens subsp. villosa]|uniref:Uncharacterized protein n=1 Tax=Deinandra increscens subsp. villosa TaxID=3103831 RepID=A0AAP0CKB5_9ASTR
MDTHPSPYSCRRDIPSFSSTLLDVIYRSIDERDDKSSVVNYRKSIRINRQIADVDHPPSGGGSKKSHVVVDRQQKSVTRFDSIDDSSGSRYGVGITSEMFGFPARPRPIRTVNIHDDYDEEYCNGTRKMNIMNKSAYDKKCNKSDDLQTKTTDGHEGKFVKTKSRAMKIYGYLKRGKQPISPGGRLATYLISLFRSTNAKKSKPYDHDETMKVHANLKSKSSSSSATSFSRSCLSKTPPPTSRGKPAGTGIKRSPASEYSQSDSQSDPPAVRFTRKEELKKHNILKNYQRKVEYVFDSINNNKNDNNDDEDEDEDEAGSYASSDLFELEHLSAIGMDECMQELPLYETTNIDVNRAIANGHHQKE